VVLQPIYKLIAPSSSIPKDRSTSKLVAAQNYAEVKNASFASYAISYPQGRVVEIAALLHCFVS